MNKIFRNLFFVAAFFVAILNLGNVSYAQNISSPIYPSVQLNRGDSGSYDSANLSWSNPDVVKEKVLNGEAVQFEIDFRVNSDPWHSAENKTTVSGTISPETVDQESVEIQDGMIPEIGKFDIFSNSYSFRIRYILADGSKSNFSFPISIGNRPVYNNASQWSEEELQNASRNGFISNGIRNDMKANMTRKEFTEVAVRVYEKTMNIHLAPGISPYRDTEDASVLKATKLGIVQGVGGRFFDPDANVTRQEIATILTRLLKVMGKSMNEPDLANLFNDHNKISEWAISPIYQLQGFGLVEGDEKHNFDPLNNTTREQGVVLGQRVYELFQK
ncbi:S-layer homology domain-containing protein [Peptoniphilus sp. KCTC 25270]|uniref:S-layer homology domain-containing protein n=1 Tax=Peptoniphilus sp. KCTC 25270 TaxID=2897414 RepID=UPI001E63A7A1|nr:S-layer homology domain-containing protein [Peptoniphilus sp. KCTC 25270]MCD1146947.1 S-layer homology domain-containing protein [Peptoniphilus sp. KCTC 25270]